MCAKLLRKLRPQESPLIVARDELICFGLNPPVVTDEWWLDVIEASNRIPDWGISPPSNTTWGRWTFPLPNPDSKGVPRGVRLAWTAMQMEWEGNAAAMKITQISRPDTVLRFISSQPGLIEAAHLYPEVLASYAPQLTIKSLSGEFEEDFDRVLEESIQKHSKTSSGSGLTTTSTPPLCDESIALRHPSFGNYQPASLACQFVQGEMFGPSPKYYEIFEYLIWMISSDSEWLPPGIHAFLIDGMAQWAVWISSKRTDPNHTKNAFLSALFKTGTFSRFRLDKSAKTDLQTWIKESLRRLQLNDNPTLVMESFLSHRFIELFYEAKKRRRTN